MTIYEFFRYLNWCRLPRKYRYFGFWKTFYNGPIYCFGFWWFHAYSLGYDPDKY